MIKRRSRRAEEDADTLEATLGLPPLEKVPAFVVLSGLPASGKSHLARALAGRYPFAVLQIDALRKTLFPEPTYSKSEHTRVFAAVHALIDRLLARKISVLYDATNLKELHRRALYDISDRNGARLRIIWVHSPAETIWQRLSGRASGKEAWSSDADEAVYEMMRLEAEPIQRPYLEVDASGDVSEAVGKIVQSLGGE
jgi:predicted kinase